MATVGAILGFCLGGLIAWMSGWLLHVLMQGLGWELGQLNIIGQIPEKDLLRTINYQIDPRTGFPRLVVKKRGGLIVSSKD